MKKLISILGFLLIYFAGYSQSPFEGFLKPVSKATFNVQSKEAGVGATSMWLFRPAVEITATKFTYNKELKQFDAASFLSTGIGIGYQHYVDNNGVPYNNLGFNLLLLINTIPLESIPEGSSASLSLAGTFSALKFIDVGGGYDFQVKKAFFLTGVKYNF